MSPEPIDWGVAPQSLRSDDARWPSGLAELPDTPTTLRLLGTLVADRPAVAVVGTRFADPDALAFAHELGMGFGQAGWVVVSGGARGVDAAAHRGALDAGGATIVVLASGLALPYPPSHEPLYREVLASGGALISEVADDTPPRRGRFLARNRLIAALSERVVVVQAPARSGAMSTASWARKLEKPLFTVPYAPWDARGEGCLNLLRQGAHICTSVRDVLSVRPLSPGEGPLPSPQRGENNFDCEDLDGDGSAVLALLGRRPRHLDELVLALGLSVPRVQRALLQLTLQGRAAPDGNGAYFQIVHSPDP